MSRWSRTSPPSWAPNAVKGVAGWHHPITNELLVAMRQSPVIAQSSPISAVAQISRNKKKFKTGDVIPFVVTFNEAVMVTGTPKLPFTINGVNKNANYVKGSGTATLQFTYVVQSGDSATAGQVVCGIAAVAATHTFGSSNSQLVLTAQTAGAAGNSITLALVNPGANGTLSVGVSGNAITVNLATDGSSVITSTANQVKAAIIASTPANALVSVGLGTGNGSGLVSAVAATNLASGSDASANSINLNGGTISAKHTFATLTSGSSNAQVAFTAVNPGSHGNDISVTIVNPGTNNAALAVSVANTNDITISLATNGSAVATSTSSQVVAAVNAHALASLLVSASIGTGNGSGTVVVASKTKLTGGTSNSPASATLTFTPLALSSVTVN